MSKLLCFSLILFSILLSSATSNMHSVQADNSNVPQLTLNIPDWWKAPVTINSVKIGDQQVLPGSSILATDDWARHLSIDATSKSEKTISYIAYAIDFTVAGEKKIYRMRLQDGNNYASPDALTAPGGLRVLKGQTHNMKFSDNAWSCHTTLTRMINERKSKIVKVELFVESVGFTDDTLWAFGSSLRRIKGTSNFVNIEHPEISNRMNHARGVSTTPQSGCCVAFLDYTTGQSNPTTAVVSCSSCPPGAGGGSCPQPQPTKEVNSLNGQGSTGLAFVGFTHC
jgi:hypothetical protein